MNKIRTHIAFTFLFLLGFAAQAQTTNQDDYAASDYFEAVKLFDEDRFEDSRRLLEAYLSQGHLTYLGQAELLLARNDLMTGGNTARIDKFIARHISNPLRFEAFYHLGEHYFNAKSYDKAIESYLAIKPDKISSQWFAHARYRIGYSYYALQQPEKALTYFREAAHYQQEDSNKANYYVGVIEYEAGNMDSALKYFLNAENDPTLIKSTAPYVAKIYLEAKQYDKVVEYVDGNADAASPSGKVVLYRLAGEAYFAQGSYRESIEYFENSIKYQKGKADASLYYKLGYAFDEIGQVSEAIDQYKLAALAETEIGDFAAFRLGELYLETSQFNFAVTAFERVMLTGEDFEAREQAMFLQAKTLYQMHRFDGAIGRFDAFLKAYPSSTWKTEATELLASSYLYTSNYDAAIDHLEQSGLTSNTTKATYQKVTFRKAEQLYNDSKFQDAAIWFEKSLKFEIDDGVKLESQFLLAECMSILQQFENAKPYYEKVMRESRPADELYYKSAYGLGYSHYNTKQYQKAYLAFSKFIESAPSDLSYRYDASTRLADCQYVQKNYDRALELYQALLGAPNQAYIRFQIGLTYYLNGKLNDSKEYFEQVFTKFPRSHYADNASLQLGEVLIDTEEFDQAEEQFSSFIESYSGSPLLPYAYLGRGLARSNSSKLKQSESDFIHILEQSPTHATAKDAILGLQGLVSKGHDVKRFDEFIEKLKVIDPNNESLESIAFEQVKAHYFNQNYERVVTSARSFESNYSNSIYLDETSYYVADSYFKQGKWSEAIEAFDAIIGKGESPFMTRVLDKQARAYLAAGDQQGAFKSYEQLYTAAKNRRETHKANEGMMKASFALGNYEEVRAYADRIEQAEWSPINGENVAAIYTAKSYIEESDYPSATEKLNEVLSRSTDESAAEATYLIAVISNRQGNYEQSIDQSIELISNYGSYQKWTDETYLLLVRNYIDMEELLQAKATLNSIIENSNNQQLVSRANSILVDVMVLENEVLLPELDTAGQ